MSEKDALSETARALGIGPVLPAIYDDLLSPAARELGDGLATIAKAVKISLAPVEATVWGYERIREWLSIRVTAILARRKVKEVQSAPLSVAGPLVFHMVFASDEPDLREMYAKLLASAMDGRTWTQAHPSFVMLIQQMTPGEAKILRHIASLDQKWPCWNGDAETSELQSAMQGVCAEAGVDDPTLADLYVENLLRLRLLRHFSGTETKYHPDESNLYGGCSTGPHVSTKQTEFIELTQYGRSFLTTCVTDEAAQQDDATDAAASRRR